MATLTSSILVYFFMSRTINRSPTADRILHDQTGKEHALPFTVVARRDQTLTLQFHPDSWIRHILIRRLFTGAYHQDVEQIATSKVFASLAQALFQ